MKDLKKKEKHSPKGAYTDVASCARRDSYGTHYISLLCFFVFFCSKIFYIVFNKLPLTILCVDSLSIDIWSTNVGTQVDKIKINLR
jgi:hypothetical protein